MKQLTIVFFIGIVLWGCGGLKTGIPKLVEKKPQEPNYEEYIKTEVSKLSYNERATLYIKRYSEIAKTEMRKYKIPASITLAQGILESGAGSGTLALKSNNHFGIKCHKEWSGSTVSHDDDSAGECFRKYRTPEMSFEDHSKFLLNRQRYANLFKLDPADYKSWAEGLKNAGYATDSKYPAKLIRLIEMFELHKYDNEVLKRTKREKKNEDEDDDNEDDKTIEKHWPKSTEVTPLDEDPPVQDGENLVIHTIQRGDTLYSISKKYNVSIDDLKSGNDLQGNALAIGQKLKIKLR